MSLSWWRFSFLHIKHFLLQFSRLKTSKKNNFRLIQTQSTSQHVGAFNCQPLCTGASHAGDRQSATISLEPIDPHTYHCIGDDCHGGRACSPTVTATGDVKGHNQEPTKRQCAKRVLATLPVIDLQFGLCYISWRKSKALKLWMAGTVIQFKLGKNMYFFIPIVSMYGIFTYIYLVGKYVGKYAIHGYYGIWIYLNVFSCCWSPGVDSCDLLGWSLVLVRLQQMQR